MARWCCSTCDFDLCDTCSLDVVTEEADLAAAAADEAIRKIEEAEAEAEAEAEVHCPACSRSVYACVGACLCLCSSSP